jgi:hypothetical protein
VHEAVQEETQVSALTLGGVGLGLEVQEEAAVSALTLCVRLMVRVRVRVRVRTRRQGGVVQEATAASALMAGRQA